MNTNNPFSDFGKIVTGERFVGRKKEITQIHSRLLGKNYGNLSIVGLPRVGKSSLAHNALINIMPQLVTQNILIIWINLGNISNAESLFLALAQRALRFMEENNLLVDEKVQLAYSRIFEQGASQIEFDCNIQSFFRLLLKKRFRVIYVLDEFDNAHRILSVENFQFLRELSNDPSTQVALVTISRRTLRELEPDNGTLSNFYQIFSEVNLGLFDENDMKDYWDYLKSFDVLLESTDINEITYFSGCHPFLLDIINCEVFNELENTSINFSKTLASIIDMLRLKIVSEYVSIFDLMKDEYLDSKVVQILVGPLYNATQLDIDRLLKYQLIRKSNGGYEGFCQYFNEYILLIQNDVNIWPLFSEFEKEMRELIRILMIREHGTEWHKEFRKRELILELEAVRSEAMRSFKNTATDDLLSYTYPRHFFEGFIASNWKLFVPILKKDKAYWNQAFGHLTKIRNPLAHNNPNFLSESDRNLATGYCQEVLSLIREWKATS